jgi:hypothetical protein
MPNLETDENGKVCSCRAGHEILPESLVALIEIATLIHRKGNG